MIIDGLCIDEWMKRKDKPMNALDELLCPACGHAADEHLVISSCLKCDCKLHYREVAEKAITSLRQQLAEWQEIARLMDERLDYQYRGTTHYAGCDADHPLCALSKRYKAALKGGS